MEYSTCILHFRQKEADHSLSQIIIARMQSENIKKLLHPMHKLTQATCTVGMFKFIVIKKK